MKRIHCIRGILFIFTLSLTQIFATPAVIIDSLSGAVEIQRSGSIEWKNAVNRSKLFSNDLIRVRDNGIAVLLWPDGSHTYLNQKSQILVTLFQKSNDTITAKNATLMSGKAFFIVKETTPGDQSEAMRVFTPTAVLSINGTAFLVEIDSTRLTTTVKMISGILQVKNVLKNIPIFLGAPYKTIIEKSANPLTPKTVLQNDIDSLKEWIPDSIIEQEIADQIDKSISDLNELTGRSEEKCIVTQLINSCDYKGQWNISKEITSQFAARLKHNIARIIVMKADTTLENPIEIAHAQKARYCIYGKIENFNLRKKNLISVNADKYNEIVIAQTGIRIQIFDIQKNKEIYNQVLSTEISGNNNLENSWESFHKKALSINDSTFSETIIGKSAEKAIGQAVDSVTKKIQQYK